MEALADRTGDKEGRALVCQNVGEAWYYLGNLDKALEYLKKAYEIASQMKKYGYYRSLTKMLIRTHYWRNDLEQARKFGIYTGPGLSRTIRSVPTWAFPWKNC